MGRTGNAQREHSREGMRYPSDMTEREWLLMAPFIPSAKTGGRRRTTDMREVVNALLYIASSGGTWRMTQTAYSGPWVRATSVAGTAARIGPTNGMKQSSPPIRPSAKAASIPMSRSPMPLSTPITTITTSWPASHRCNMSPKVSSNCATARRCSGGTRRRLRWR